MAYIKKDDQIYQVTEVKRKIDLKAMKKELAELEAMEEPTNEELIELGRQNHPYYQDREGRMAYLKAQIKEIEKIG